MRLDEFAGEVTISSEQAVTFIKNWFRPDDKIAISGLRSERSGGLDSVAQSMTAQEFIDTTDDDALRGLVFDDDGGKWNIYVSVSPVKEDVTLKQRGTKLNMAYLPGVWADIDVQDGGFESQEILMDWLDTLELKPTMICSSGSSGVHAYWKFSWNERVPAPVLKNDENLAESWWSYLNEAAGEGRAIDKLVDCTRILRLPGTLRFPKSDDRKSSKIGRAELLEVHPERVYTSDRVREVSAAAAEKYANRRAETIKRDAQQRMDVDEIAAGLINADGKGKWGFLQAAAFVEDYVNDNWSWNAILEPHGWKFRRELYDGSHEWARPGQNDRSAVTNFENSPVMSLLSWSESTNLADLRDAGIPLTKYRVALRLMFDDDRAAMLHYIANEQKSLVGEGS